MSRPLVGGGWGFALGFTQFGLKSQGMDASGTHLFRKPFHGFRVDWTPEPVSASQMWMASADKHAKKHPVKPIRIDS